MTKSQLVIEVCSLCAVIPFFEVADLEDAEPLARVLLWGGLRVLEVTLRTDSGLDVIFRMSNVEGAIVGADTIRTPEDVRAAKEAGAASASEVMTLLEKGYTALKFFPAEVVGRRAVLKSLAGPLPNAMFCPTGGITPQTANQYLELRNVMCVGGSWIAPTEQLGAKDWQEIKTRAQHANEVGGVARA